MDNIEDKITRFVAQYLETQLYELSYILEDEYEPLDKVGEVLQNLHHMTGLLCTWAATKRYMENSVQYLEDVGLIFD